MLSATPSIIKKQKDLIKELNNLYNRNKSRIIKWLIDIAVEYNGVHNNKISGLLTTSQIKINTKNEQGVYNLILIWFLNNKEKFKEDAELFDNIPSTTFTKISKTIMLKSTTNSSSPTASSVKQDITEQIKKWKENPHKNPYDDSDIKISIIPTSEYGKLYEKFCNYLSSNLEKPILPITFEKEIRNKLPNNHIYAFKDINYIENLKSLYPNEEWINFLDKKKDIFYKNENINDVKGSTVFDFLFMHFFLIKNKKGFEENVVIDYIDKPLFLYETILAQIKHIKAIDLNCYEIFESMVHVYSDSSYAHMPGDNFKIIKATKTKLGEWPYEIPPLLNLFIEYINEITYYILPISNLDKVIYNDFFLYGKKKPGTSEEIYNLITESIQYNIYRLKTILNVIFGSLYTNYGDGISERINIKAFLNILFYNISECISRKNTGYKQYKLYEADEYKLIAINDILAYTRYKEKYLNSLKIDEYKFKMFLVSAIFDIKTLHEESYETNNSKYEFIKDPYDNLPTPPEVPKPVIITQALQRYKMTSHIVGKNSKKEKELKEFEKKQSNYIKELKEYDKSLKQYNDEHLGKKLSPYFSIKLSRAKSEINDKSSLRLSYSPLKVSAKSLTKFESQKKIQLLEKFEEETTDSTKKRRKEKFNRNRALERLRVFAQEKIQRESVRERAQEKERERQREKETRIGWGGSSKKILSKSDLKLKLALAADDYKTFNGKTLAKSLTPSGKSPRQKYIECDLNDNDPLTQQAFSDMHFKKIKYLSKIKTTLENGKIITNCYDTIPLYNYILDCNNKGIVPVNYAQGRTPFDILQLDEVYKKIKNFTKKPTLERNINTSHKIFLNTLYVPPWDEMYGLPFYTIFANIIIGSIPFPISRDNYNYWEGGMHKIIEAPFISTDDILFEDTSDNTALLIQKGVEKGSLLKVNKYPYWHREGSVYMPNPLNDLLILQPFSWSSYDDFDEIKQKTHILNNSIQRLI